MGEFDWGVIWKYREVLWDGMLTSLKLFAIALAGGIFFGTLLAMAKSLSEVSMPSHSDSRYFQMTLQSNSVMTGRRLASRPCQRPLPWAM